MSRTSLAERAKLLDVLFPPESAPDDAHRLMANPSRVGVVLQRFLEEGLAAEGPYGWELLPDFRYALLSSGAKEPTWKEKFLDPNLSRHGIGDDLPRSLFCDDADTFERKARHELSLVRGRRDRAENMFFGFGRDLPYAVLDRLPAFCQELYLEAECALAFEHRLTMDAGARFDWLLQRGFHALSVDYAIYALLIGQPINIRSDMHELAEALAFQAVVKGDWEEARRQAARAMGAEGKSRRRRLSSRVSIVLTLVLATGETEYRALARHQIPNARGKQRGYSAINAWLSGGQLTFSSGPGWQELLTGYLVYLWTKTEDTPYMVFSTHEEASLLRQGMQWPGMQLRAVRTALSERRDQASELDDIPYLTHLVTPKSKWEQALERLEARWSVAEESRASTGERLVWEAEVVTTERSALGQVQLTPILQKLTKKGWSPGKQVSLRTLENQRDLPPYLDLQDQALLRYLHTEIGRYGERRLVFREEVALALVGHPRVVTSVEREPIEVVEGQVALQVQAVKKGKGVFLRVDPLCRGSVGCLLEGRTLTVYRKSEPLRELMLVVGDRGIHIPADGADRLGRLLERLTKEVPVRSDLSGGAELEPADPQPVLELRRRGDGFHLVLSVHPLGQEGPRFAAGHGSRVVSSSAAGLRGMRRCERDFDQEVERLKSLTLTCPSLEGLPSNALIQLDFLDAMELLHQVSSAVSENQNLVKVVWPEGDPLEVKSATESMFRLSLKSAADDWFSLEGELSVGEDKVFTLGAFLELVSNRRGRFVQLSDQELLSLSDSLLSRAHLLSAAGELEQKSMKMGTLAAGLVCAQGDVAEVKMDRKAKSLLKRFQTPPPAPQVPSTLTASLRDYQETGFSWLSQMAHWGAGACLADDMGLGKTLQALTLLLSRAPSGPQLVCAPTSVCGNWMDEAERFSPSLNLWMFDEQVKPEAFDVVVLSHTMLALHKETLQSISWTTVVIDEAQAIKNPATQRAKAAYALKANFRVALTGTPIENHLIELWSLMNFLNPGLLGTQKHFEKRFSRPIQNAKQDVPEQLLQLKELISPFVLRRTKREVLKELPARTELTEEIEPSQQEAALLEAIRRKAVEEFQSSGKDIKESAIHFLAQLTRLRQAACHPALVAPELKLPSSKLERLVELIHELMESGHRALIFSQFVSFLDLVEARFVEEGIERQRLDGSTPAAKRKEAVRDFQSGKGDVFLISLKAGGTGLNLTGADYVIHLDPWWNPAVEDQASDRAHRIGQKRPVTVVRLVTAGSVEAKVLRLHADKRNLASQILEGTHKPSAPDAEVLYRLLTG